MKPEECLAVKNYLQTMDLGKTRERHREGSNRLFRHVDFWVLKRPRFTVW